MSGAGLVIFDCDGVLIDSEPIAARVLAEILTAAGLEFTTAEVQARFTGAAATEIVAILGRDYALMEPELIMAEYHIALHDVFRRELCVVPGIDDLLAALRQPVCVASNSGLERLEKSLGLLPIRSRFGNHVYSAEMVTRPKPAPDLIRLCLERTRTTAADAVMIDDNPHGIAAAAAAGVRSIGFVTPGETRQGRVETLRAAGAWAVVGSVDELAEMLRVALPA